MKKMFLLVLGILTFLVSRNVYAENLVMNYYGNPYYVISGNGEYHSSIVTYFELDGDVVYCVEPGILVTDFNYLEEDINTLPYNTNQINLIKLIGYYGYEYPTHTTSNYRMATQALIWENLTGKTVNFYTEKNGGGTIVDVTSERNEIMRLVNSHSIIPNISNDLTLSINEDNILFDSNNVLDNFDIINNNPDLEVFQDGNNLHIKTNKIGKYSITLRKKKYDNKTTLLYVASNGLSQKLMKLRYDDEVQLKLNINIVGGKVNLQKLDSETKTNLSVGNSTLSNAKYGIYDEDNNLITLVLTDTLGNATSDNLKFGKYYLKEVSPSYGYLKDETSYEFIIDKDNLVQDIQVYEELNKKEVTIIKTLEGDLSILGGEENITFEIYFEDNNELYKTITTNKDGVAKIKLPYGIYIFHQVNSNEGYLKSDDFKVTIDENTNEIYKVVYDKRVRGKINIIKSDLDNNKKLKDAFIEVYKDDKLIYSGYTNEEGNIELTDLYVGKYKIIETIAPNGYILNNQEYFVDITNDTFDEVIEIKNKHKEIIVPNTGVEGKNNLKYSSIGIMLFGFSLIIFSYKKKIFK